MGMKRAIYALLVLALIGHATAQPVPNPFSVVSETEPGGEFSVFLAFQRTSEACFSVPAGRYSQVWTLIAPFEDVTARAWLNLYRDNANAAAPKERGLQISQRFELFKPDTSGDLWRVHETGFDGPAVLCAGAGSSPEVGMVWQVKLIGKGV